MAVTGVFEAEFESFFAAVQKADLHLKTLDTGAAKVESSLTRMGNSFSGNKVISEARLMAEIFDRAGGAASFTESELRRMSATGTEAVAKLKALGQDVPPGIQRIADASKNAELEQKKLLDTIGQSGGRLSGLSEGAKGTNAAVSTLSSTYRQFDGVLQSAGINIGPMVKGLEDVVAVGGTGVGTFTKIGVAVAGAAASFKVGWDFGRWIADWTGLDKAVENAWRSLLKYGDVAAETAGAKQDTINRAIAQGARENISYADAIEFNIAAVKKNADAKIDWTAKLAAAQKEVRGLTDAQKNDIEIATQAGATQEQLTNKFGVSALALKVLADRQREAAVAAEEHRAKAEALDKAYEKLNSQIANERGLAQMEAEAAAMKQRAEQEAMFNDLDIKARIKRQEAINAEAAAEAKAEEQRVANNQKEIDGLLAAAATHQEAGTVAQSAAAATVAGYQGVAAQITLTGEAVREYINLMRYSAQVNAILSENSLFTTQSQRERIAAIGNPSALPSNAPLGGGGGGQVFNNTFHIVDTESNITRRVSENIMRNVRAGSQLTQ